MLFIWGKGGGRAIAGDAGYHKCDHCNDATNFVAVVDYYYFHFWYLFSFLTSRQYAVICSQCGNGSNIDKSEFKAQYKKDHVPIIRKWGWLICFLILACFIGYAKFNSDQHDGVVTNYISQPVINDIYLADLSKINNSGYEEEKYAYGAMKLIKIDTGTNLYYFAVSESAYNKKKYLKKEFSSLTYAQGQRDIIVLTDQEVTSLKSANIIYDIIRR